MGFGPFEVVTMVRIARLSEGAGGDSACCFKMTRVEEFDSDFERIFLYDLADEFFVFSTVEETNDVVAVGISFLNRSVPYW